MAAIPDLFATQAMYDSQFIKNRADMSGLDVQHPETEYRLKKVSEKFIESVHLMVNEPSVGLYRIQEHVRRSLPQLVDRKIEMESYQNQVHGVCYDLDYSIKTVQSMQKIPHFTIIQECLRSAIASKQSLDKARAERKNKKTEEKAEPQAVNEDPEVIEQVEQQQGVEGFICPMCMQVWSSQDELLTHWQQTHETILSNDDATNEAPTLPPDSRKDGNSDS